MKDHIGTLKPTARLAGCCYLLILLISVFTHMYVPSKIYVREDAALTTSNILNNEFLFRTCIAAGLLEAVSYILLALTLYRLFRQVDRILSGLMLALLSVQLPVMFVLAAFKISALAAATLSVSSTITPTETPALVMLLLKTNEHGMMALELLSGLWLIPFGLLVQRSRFIPWFLGLLLLMAAGGYTAASLLFILLPRYNQQAQVMAMILSATGELSMMFWLLIKGVKESISLNVIVENYNPGPISPSAS